MRSLKEWIAWADRCSTVSVVEISPKQCGELRDTLTSLLNEMELVTYVLTHPVAIHVRPPPVPPAPAEASWRHALNRTHPAPTPVKKTPCAACRGITVDGVEQRVCGRCRGSGVE